MGRPKNPQDIFSSICGYRLYKLRKEKANDLNGRSQTVIAKDLGTTDKTISNWETGRISLLYSPDVDKLVKLLDADKEKLLANDWRPFEERLVKGVVIKVLSSSKFDLDSVDFPVEGSEEYISLMDYVKKIYDPGDDQEVMLLLNSIRDKKYYPEIDSWKLEFESTNATNDWKDGIRKIAASRPVTTVNGIGWIDASRITKNDEEYEDYTRKGNALLIQLYTKAITIHQFKTKIEKILTEE